MTPYSLYLVHRYGSSVSDPVPWCCVQVFVKMVGANVNVMEEHVTQAEKEQGTLPGAFRKIFRTISVPSFLNVRSQSINAHLSQPLRQYPFGV